MIKTNSPSPKPSGVVRLLFGQQTKTDCRFCCELFRQTLERYPSDRVSKSRGCLAHWSDEALLKFLCILILLPALHYLLTILFPCVWQCEVPVVTCNGSCCLALRCLLGDILAIFLSFTKCYRRSIGSFKQGWGPFTNTVQTLSTHQLKNQCSYFEKTQKDGVEQ